MFEVTSIVEKRKQQERLRGLGGKQVPLLNSMVRIGVLEMVKSEQRSRGQCDCSPVRWEENGG